MDEVNVERLQKSAREEARIVLDIWGGEQSMEHIARYFPTIDEAFEMARAELASGYLINMRAEVAWGTVETFDDRAGAA